LSVLPLDGKGAGMWALLDKIPYTVVIILAVWMLLAPFRPMPHALEKFNMLLSGTLSKPIDIFDLFFHLAPTIILLLKLFRSFTKRHIKTDR
jgi:hypothetical protein